ncbi:MAG: hypothetical protein IPK13_20870 [Deltaproteobacteria bacterium]|nr:hypothetical protein [Deltaproteobacteria bacterium]
MGAVGHLRVPWGLLIVIGIVFGEQTPIHAAVPRPRVAQRPRLAVEARGMDHVEIGQDAGAVRDADVSGDGGGGREVDIEACRKLLRDHPPSSAAGRPRIRLRLVLEDLATSCIPLSATLRRAAHEAAGVPTAHQRMQVLFRASGRADRCASPGSWSFSATKPARRCPPPDALALSPALLEDLDSGTYLFTLAVADAMAEHGLLEPDGKFVLLELLLSSALERRANRSERPSP